MSKKHNNPTAPKHRTRFRKVVDLGSASAWDTFNLDLFHVDFRYDEFTELTTIVTEEFYKLNPEEEIDQRKTSFVFL
jgi:hypothetical protein